MPTLAPDLPAAPSLPADLPVRLPLRHGDSLSPAARRGAAAGMVVAHLAGAWGLLQLDPVREAMGEVAPLLVTWIAPPAAAPVPIPPPPPPPPRVQPRRAPAPAPLVSAAPSPAPAAFEAGPPEPPAPVMVVEPPAAPPAPPAPAVAPATPKTLASTAVEYLRAPVLVYPVASRRLRESGQVQVKVLVDEQGLPHQLVLLRPSGYTRLDEAALATVRATRFKPYTENGVAQPFWVVMPLIFDME